MHGELFISGSGEDSYGGNEACCLALSIQGAVGRLTDSKYLASVGGRQVLVDCSLFQGFYPLRLQPPLPQTVKLISFSISKESAMKHQSNEHNFKDPVCGMEVSRTSAVAEFVYQGKTYYFCAESCRATFEAEPEKYLRHHRQHGMQPN